MTNYGPRSVSTPSVEAAIFGSGADGVANVTGLVTLTRDMEYSNLTISGAGSILTSGFMIRVSGILDLSAASVGAILNIGHSIAAPRNNAGNATANVVGTAGPSGGTAGSVSSPYTIGAAAAGTTGAGAAAGSLSLPALTPYAIATLAGAVGGAGTNAGGAAVAATSVAASGGVTSTFYGNVQAPSCFIAATPAAGVVSLRNGGGGPGGSSGGGDGTNLSGAGGGGGGVPGWVCIAANIINRGASTASGAIYAHGGNGGNGGTPTAGNTGGGAGGIGSAGGPVWIIAGSLTGAVATGAIDISGGAGGNGGNGFGTGLGGGGGPGGQTGFCMLKVLNPASITLTAPGTAGGAAVPTGTITGAIGAAGAALLVNL